MASLTPDRIAHLRTDLLAYTQYMHEARRGGHFRRAPHQDAIATALERVVIGASTRLIINVPPRSGKTEMAVKAFMSWCMGNWPDSEFIHASYSKRLATANTWEARAWMQHEAWAALFGPPALQHDSNAKDEFRTTNGGVVYATGAEGTITGYGAGKMRDTFGGAIVIDDPHKAGEGNSATMRRNVLDWFSTTMESRKNSPDTPIILIMQRLHEEDLSGWLLDGGNGEAWDHVCIPAIDNAGQSFWPEQFPLDDLRRIESANSYVFAGQYGQRPAPVGGGIFKDAWWQMQEEPPALTHRIIFADTAQKTSSASDYSVFQCWGYTADRRAVLLDMIRGKWEAPELLERSRAFWAKHKAQSSPALGTLRSMNVEDKVSGTGLIQTLRREGVPVLGIPRSRDKVTRAMDAAPKIQAGHVILLRGVDHLSDMMAEASAFPKGAHDDTIDPMMDAVAAIDGPARRTTGILSRRSK